MILLILFASLASCQVPLNQQNTISFHKTQPKGFLQPHKLAKVILKTLRPTKYKPLDPMDLPLTDRNDPLYTFPFYKVKPLQGAAIFNEKAYKEPDSYAYAIGITNPEFPRHFDNFPGIYEDNKYPLNYKYLKFNARDKVLYSKSTFDACRHLRWLLYRDDMISYSSQHLDPFKLTLPDQHYFVTMVQERNFLSGDPTIKGFKTRFIRLNHGGIWSFKEENRVVSFKHDFSKDPYQLAKFFEDTFGGTFKFCTLHAPGSSILHRIDEYNSGDFSRTLYH